MVWIVKYINGIFNKYFCRGLDTRVTEVVTTNFDSIYLKGA